MTERGRREYAERLRQRYQLADKRERGRLLDEYCRITECHRKAAIRRLRAVGRPRGRAPGRPVHYGRELLPLLEQLWRASDYLSGKLLHPIVPTLLTALQTHHGLAVTAPVRAALLAASPATLDRLLRPLRRRRPRQPRRAGTARHLVRAQVPAAHLERVDRRGGGRDARRPGLALRGVHSGALLRHARRRRRRHDLDGAAGDLGPAPAARHRRHPRHRPAGAVCPARVA